MINSFEQAEIMIHTEEPTRFNKAIVFTLFAIGAVAYISALNIVSIPSALISAAFGAFFILCPRRYFVPILMFVIPLSAWLNLYSIISIAGLIYIFRYYEEIDIEIGIILMVYILIAQIISGFYTTFSLSLYIKTCIVYLTFALFIFTDRKEEHIDHILLSFVFGFIVSSTIVLSILNEYFTFAYIFEHMRLGLTSFSSRINTNMVIFNENEFGVMAATSIGILLALYNKNPSKSLIYIPMLVFSLLIGFMTKSITFLVLLAALIFILIWSTEKLSKKMLISILVMLVIGTIAFTLYSQFPGYYEEFTSSFTSSDISNGRIENIKAFNQIFINEPKYWLFGVGTQDYERELGIAYSFHNSLQQILVTQGILGALLMCAFFYAAYKFGIGNTSNLKRTLIYISPLFMLILGTQATGLWILFYLLLPAVYSLKLARYE